MALCRARVWALDGNDLYKEAFLTAARLNVGWAEASRALLVQWGLQDWPDTPALDYDDYKRYICQAVADRFLPSWRGAVARHTAQVPYSLIQGHPSDVLGRIGALELPWRTQISVRGWIRLRAGLVCLRHRNGRRSTARYQMCIGCNCTVRNATSHAIARCQCWSELREAIFAMWPGAQRMLVGQFTLAVLKCPPESLAFPSEVALAQSMDCMATRFWSGRTKSLQQRRQKRKNNSFRKNK